MSDYAYKVEENLLNVEKLNVAYNGVSVLKDVDFRVENITRIGLTQGQVNAVLAPSGTGKSQLFRCISGLKTPDSGKVFIKGDIEVKTGMVGFVAQDYPLFGHLTVLDNLMLAATVKEKDHKKALEACMGFLHKFELETKAKSYPHQISGGQRQRISIIQQMLSCGHLLLMDEPFSGLDPLMKERAQSMITDLAASDELNSIIITTHDINAAISVADTISLLGRQRDEHGTIIPGAAITHTYNLIDRGIAWRPDNYALPAFNELAKEITARFHEL